jgi:cell division protein FtsW (lipid II flippase)
MAAPRESAETTGRSSERQILFWVWLCQVLGFLLVLGIQAERGRPPAAADLMPLVLSTVAMLGVHLFLVLIRFRGDQTLLAAALFLSGLGLLAQYRMGALNPARGGDDWRALTFLAGPVLFAVTLTFFRGGRYGWLERLGPLAGLLSLGLVAALLAMGSRFRGAVFAPGRFTPTELLKILVVIALAATLTRRRDELSKPSWFGLFPKPSAWMPLAIYWTLLCGLLLLQRDLGMALILSAVLACMLLMATGRIRYILVTVLGAAGAGWLAWEHLAHSQRRFQAWLDPFGDPTGSGWQVLQGLSGMFAGGMWGAGFGQGNPERIPIAASDFIYAVIGEEFGFVGCVLLVCVYLLFFHRGLTVARSCHRLFDELLVGGLMTVFVVQAFVNIGGVTKAIPLTGVTLPFVSQGGSSFLTSFLGLAIILAASEPAPKARRGRSQ